MVNHPGSGVREDSNLAGSELVHRISVRDWKKLTVRAVAERAGVNERTVYRYFGSERERPQRADIHQ